MIDLNKLRRLKLPLGEYCVFGSGPMEMAGIRQASTTDIIVKEELWKRLAHSREVIDKKMIIMHGVQVYKNWLPWLDNHDKVIDNAEIIEGVAFAQLTDVLAWKKASDSPDDKLDVKLIEDFLGVDEGK